MQTITVEVEISDDKWYCEDCQFCKLDEDGIPYCIIFDEGLNQYYDLVYRARECREMSGDWEDDPNVF